MTVIDAYLPLSGGCSRSINRALGGGGHKGGAGVNVAVFCYSLRQFAGRNISHDAVAVYCLVVLACVRILNIYMHVCIEDAWANSNAHVCEETVCDLAINARAQFTNQLRRHLTSTVLCPYIVLAAMCM
jgi:hypothetical protein